MRRITVIGGGASGTLLATNLLKYDGEERLEINLVEMRSKVGGGVVFSTDQDIHLLNVPAAKMGAFADDVEHFHRWLKENDYNYEPTSFVPRKIFGDYLRENLEDTIRNKSNNVTLNIFDDEAVDVVVDKKDEGGRMEDEVGTDFDPSAFILPPSGARKAQVILRSGDILYSEKVALAFGNFLPPHPSVEDKSFTSSPKYFQDPWRPDVFERIDKDDSVLIIGTGLSMVDVTLQLATRGHQGHINAISTRGLLPAVHKLGFTYPSFYDEIKTSTKITEILKTVRRHAAAANEDGSDWRAVIDSLRPHTQELWLNLPLPEKKYFMQHLSRYWNVSRHRMPPEAAEQLDELVGIGQLRLLKGRLQTIKAKEYGGFEICYQTIGVEHTVEADVIVNCIGSESKFDRLDSVLVQNLLAAGSVRVDDLRFGLDATPSGAIIDRSGQPSEIMYTLGTALKGILWESTAIPEIRVQARDLAEKLISH